MTVTIELRPSLQEQVRLLAEMRGTSVEEIVAEAVEAFVSLPQDYIPLEERRAWALPVIRQLAAERGLDWDTMIEAARETLIDELLHDSA